MNLDTQSLEWGLGVRLFATWSLLIGCFVCFFGVIASGDAKAVALANEIGEYQAAIVTPGGEVRFPLQLRFEAGKWKTTVGRGEGAWEIAKTDMDANRVLFVIPEYDAQIEARSQLDGSFLGAYRRTRGKGLEANLPFRMVRKEATTSVVDIRRFVGRWKLKFADSEESSVAIFGADKGRIVGTILTTTGDYRYLDGEIDAQSEELHLSAFDGGHVFLIKGRLDTKDSLIGEFWSGDWYQVDWKAQRDSEARLPSGFGMARVRDDVSLGDLEFPDLDGTRRGLNSPELLGELTIIELFGSWCPNCHDAAAMLGDLHRQYRERGLKIVGLAFELTGDPVRDRIQVKRFIERHEIDYPVLIAGVSDKAIASEAFPLLDRIRAYPSFLFVDRHCQVVGTYAGFSGPATGDEHLQLRKQFVEKIEQLLAP